MHITIGHSTGKTYRVDLDDTTAMQLHDVSIGDEIDGSLLGLDGYQLRVQGGSDLEGFPMRPGVPHTERKQLILTGGTGVRSAENGLRLKKSVRGETVSSDIAQLNLKVVQEGKTGIEEALGLKGEESGEESADDSDSHTPS